jgi:hypothetical protein
VRERESEGTDWYSSLQGLRDRESERVREREREQIGIAAYRDRGIERVRG